MATPPPSPPSPPQGDATPDGGNPAGATPPTVAPKPGRQSERTRPAGKKAAPAQARTTGAKAPAASQGAGQTRASCDTRRTPQAGQAARCCAAPGRSAPANATGGDQRRHRPDHPTDRRLGDRSRHAERRALVESSRRRRRRVGRGRCAAVTQGKQPPQGASGRRRRFVQVVRRRDCRCRHDPGGNAQALSRIGHRQEARKRAIASPSSGFVTALM